MAWQTFEFNVNGFQIQANYKSETIDTLFYPLLRKLTRLQEEKQRRIIVFLAAAPAVGKSTLASFISYLSNQGKFLTPIQSIGLDGFHYPQSYIKEHRIEKNGMSIPMVDVKGCPETFDIEKITEKIKAMKDRDINWPIYDRNLHDVVDDQIHVRENIILIEGNWLLLQDDQWRDLKNLCDYSIFITAKEHLLKDRLIQRKLMGGSTQEEATNFYDRSDRSNVLRVLNDSQVADEEWILSEDKDYKRKEGKRENNE